MHVAKEQDIVVSGNNIKHPPVIRGIAHFFSFVFHPLFIPAMATAYLVFLYPSFFTGSSAREKWMVIIRVAYNTIFYPALTIILLKSLGFIKSIYLKNQRERIIPFVATNIFYFWIYLVLKNQPETPAILKSFVLGIFIASSLGLLANIYFKISMHALGMGAFAGLMLVIVFSGFSYVIFLPAMIVFLLTGIVGTSRLIVGTHTPFDIYSGILFGILSQFIAFLVVG